MRGGRTAFDNREMSITRLLLARLFKNNIYINGKVLIEDYINDLPLVGYEEEIEIPSDHYWVVVKHPDKDDELLYGLVHRSQIISRVLFSF